MATIVYTSFGKDVVSTNQVQKLAQEHELEYRNDDEGLVVFFDDNAQRIWFCNQVRMVKVRQPNIAVNVDIDERYLDYFNAGFAERNAVVIAALAQLCPTGPAGIYSTCQNIDPESKQGRYVERYYFISFKDQDVINGVVDQLIEELTQTETV